MELLFKKIQLEASCELNGPINMSVYSNGHINAVHFNRLKTLAESQYLIAYWH